MLALMPRAVEQIVGAALSCVGTLMRIDADSLLNITKVFYHRGKICRIFIIATSMRASITETRRWMSRWPTVGVPQ